MVKFDAKGQVNFLSMTPPCQQAHTHTISNQNSVKMDMKKINNNKYLYLLHTIHQQQLNTIINNQQRYI